jgi:hypothetical protein
MEAFKQQVNEACEQYAAALVKTLSEKYGFDYTAGLVVVEVRGVEGKKRGRPESTGKKVVNKTALVEDVIMSLMAEQTPEPVVEPVVEKKKAAVKKAKTPEPVAVEQVAEASVEQVAEAVVAVAEPVVAKKKPAVKKAKTPEPVAEGVVVEPVVAKKKPAVKKATTAPVEQVAEAVVAAEPVVAKKKPAVKKAQEPAVVEKVIIATAEPPAVQAPAIQAPASSELRSEPFLSEGESEEDDEIKGSELVYKGVTYLLTEDNVLYDYTTQDAVGTWTGSAIEPL